MVIIRPSEFTNEVLNEVSKGCCGKEVHVIKGVSPWDWAGRRGWKEGTDGRIVVICSN